MSHKAFRDLLIRARDAYGQAPLELLVDEYATTGIVEPTSIIVNEQIEREQIEQLLAEGMEGIGKLESGQDPGLLTPRELAGTEAIVLLFNRPALLISNGTFLS